MTKRRCHNNHPTPSLAAAALRVLLCRNSDFVSGHEDCIMLCALMQTSQSIRCEVEQWATQELNKDITRHHEAPVTIPVWRVDENGESTISISNLLALLRFRYVTSVRIPVARARHELPVDQQERLRRENKDVARVIRGCAVRLYAAYASATGWGIHAAQRIPSGEYVGEYTGELIASAEARRRHQTNYDRTGLNYVLALREQTAGGTQVVRTNVDASRYGCYTRFFNHSCAPTLRVEALRVDSFVPRLVLFTQRELAVGDELTFDYGCNAIQQGDLLPSNSTDNAASVRCHCGAGASCRGVMPFDASL